MTTHHHPTPSPLSQRFAEETITIPLSPPPLDVAAAFQEALSVYDSGNRDHTRQLCQRILQQHPRHKDALNLLAVMAQQESNSEQAEYLLRRAIASDPKEPAYPHNLALSLIALERLDEAVDALREADRLGFDRYVVQSDLGRVLGQLNRLDEAIDVQQALLDYFPADETLLNDLVINLQRRGDHDQAMTLVEEGLEVHPLSHPLQICRANGLFGLGQFQEAIEAYREILERDPDFAPLWGNLGISLRVVGRIQEAVDALNRSLTCDPDYHTSYNVLGMIALDRHETNQALELFSKALQRQPECSQTLCNLAFALIQKEELEQAEQLLLHVLERDNTVSLAHTHMGTIRVQQGRPEEALACFERAIASDPTDWLPRMNAGLLQLEERQLDAARWSLESARELHLSEATIHNSLGLHALVVGELTEAESHFRAALTRDRHHVNALYNLSRCRKFPSTDDPDLRTIESLLVSDVPSTAERASLHFAMGKMLDDCRAYDRAFPHIIEANRLFLEVKRYPLESAAPYFQRLKSLYSPEWLADSSIRGSRDESPIFIVGLPRSGTSLLEQILASHHQIAGCGEMSYFLQLQEKLPDQLASDEEFPECLHELTQEAANTLITRYLDQARRMAGNTPFLRFTDKMPYNYQNLGLIAKLFPKAKVLYCRRNPFDTAVSLFFQKFSNGNYFSFDLEAIGRYIRQQEDFMHHWMQVATLPTLEVHYESVVTEPEQSVARILAFLDLPWDDACMTFHTTKRAVGTASNWQVRQPIYQNSVERWRRYETFLQPMIRAYQDNNW
ncbi:MAG: tetratricopeptide repeat protein [Magnetococcales bacterium]|nr:tetratricopeptide repeat protein [Magnetococcales bacterium]